MVRIHPEIEVSDDEIRKRYRRANVSTLVSLSLQIRLQKETFCRQIKYGVVVMITVKINDQIVSCFLYEIISKQDARKYLIDQILCEQLLYTPKANCFVQETKINLHPINLDIYLFKNVKISSDSDFIRFATNKCYWYKIHYFFYYKTIPLDKDLIHIDSHRVLLQAYQRIEHITTPVVSLIGATATSWSHFLTQYLPKIEIARSYFDVNQKVIIAVPDDMDHNCLELINFAKPDMWTIKKLSKEILYRCDELLYIDHTSWITDHSKFFTLGDIILYDKPIKILFNIVNRIKKRYISRDSIPHKKLYVRRDPATHRAMINTNELDLLMDKLGYEVISDPHKYSIEEKVKIFSEAKIIVGQMSSALTNATIFCQENTKIFDLRPKLRMGDTLGVILSKYSNIDVTFIFDDNFLYNDMSHPSYYIDINKIKQILLEQT